jgi:hypothetical protein
MTRESKFYSKSPRTLTHDAIVLLLCRLLMDAMTLRIFEKIRNQQLPRTGARNNQFVRRRRTNKKKQVHKLKNGY